MRERRLQLIHVGKNGRSVRFELLDALAEQMVFLLKQAKRSLERLMVQVLLNLLHGDIEST